MPTFPVSYQDYAERMTKETASLDAYHQQVFCAHCAEFMLRRSVKQIEEQCGSSVLEQLDHLIDDVWRALQSRGKINKQGLQTLRAWLGKLKSIVAI